MIPLYRPLGWLDPLELSEMTGDYEASGGDALSSQRRSAAPSGSSRYASRAKPAAAIAGALADLRGLAIGMASAFTILFMMRGTI
jgi:hypothetical protein